MIEASAKPSKLLQELLSSEGIHEINEWIAKYPPQQKQSALLSALRIAQEEKGYLTPEVMDAVADYLEIPATVAYEVATFYSMYDTKPVGRNRINVCMSISCKLCDSSKLLSHMKKKLGIELGETTTDGRYTLRAVECLAACVNAPMMQVNKDYHENLTPEKIDAILEQYK
ncbi:MAG: NADH-quinone oxidoreductase subunit NuoE [Legionella sp.]|nr:NADH-quinone oxidoreductase subunit NuoE [Legionella sp.]